MAKNQGKRLPSGKLEADAAGFNALQTIRDYHPVNSTYSLDAVTAAYVALRDSRKVESEAAAAAAAARDNAVAQEWLFHNLMLGVKEQIIAQFGKDSHEVQALGLKRKSDYKPPRRRSASGDRRS